MVLGLKFLLLSASETSICYSEFLVLKSENGWEKSENSREIGNPKTVPTIFSFLFSLPISVFQQPISVFSYR